MVPLAASVHRATATDGVATWRVRYRYRGWNGAEASPAADARWVLDQVRRRHGDVPVVLLGHSMGGRTALRVADDGAVTGVVALAPWLPAQESVAAIRGRSVVIVHAAQDRWTSPAESRFWLERARPLARSACYVRVDGAGHFMLRRASVWSSLATGFVVAALREAGVTDRTVRGPGANIVASAADGAIDLRI